MSLRFTPHEPAALLPRAFGMEGFFHSRTPESAVGADGIATIPIRGPLMHHPSWCFDSYDAIRERVSAAIAAGAKTVVLDLDTPGGLVSGAFDCARELQALAAAADVRLVAYVAGQACSAGYSLACACDEIVASPTSLVGSIGVIDALLDLTAQDAMYGARFAIVASGARKADGAPHQALTDDAIAARQSTVDELARAFAALVAERRGRSVDEVLALEAATFTGASAVAIGLVDRVATRDEFLTQLRAGPTQKQEAHMGAKAGDEPKKKDDVADAIATLRRAAEDGDEKAKRMLAAMEDEDEDEDKPSAESDEDSDEEKPAAESEEKPSAKTREAKLEADLREALLAGRPDLKPEQRAKLEKLDTESLRVALSAIPKPSSNRAAAGAATTTVMPTLGETQKSGAKPQTESSRALAQEMGLVKTELAVIDQGNKLILGGVVPRKDG